MGFKYKCLLIIIAIICVFVQAQGQQFYLRPYARYHQEIGAQIAPKYFTVEVASPYGYLVRVSAEIRKLSIASGIKYGIVAGYQLNDVLGVEAGIDYFNTDKTVEADATFDRSPHGFTNWKYHSVQGSPGFTFRATRKKSSLTGKAGIIIGLAWLENSIYLGDYDLKTYKMGKNISLGYQLGLEYNYHLKHGFSIVAECGLEHSSYTPSKANLTLIKKFTSISVEQQNVYTKEINYVREIDNLVLHYDPYTGDYLPDQNQPELRIKEALRMSTAYVGLGVKYNL